MKPLRQRSLPAARLLCSVTAILVLNACAETGRIEPLAKPDVGAIPDPGPYVREGQVAAGPPLPNLRFAPSVGTCAPQAVRGAVTACCSEQACNGHCVADERGTSQCSCYGKAGGCGKDEICSKLSHKCTKANAHDLRPYAP